MAKNHEASAAKRASYLFLCSCFLLLQQHAIYGQPSEKKKQKYLEDLIRLQDKPASLDSFVSHHDKTWLGWQQRTGELPPDFDALPSIPFLPDLLMIDEGGKSIPVSTLAQWKEQREFFKKHIKHIISGTFPPAPGNVVSKVIEERFENGVKIQLIELRFGKNQQARLTIELFTPPGDGPFPVFMTQWNHRGWAQVAVRRGYIGLIYAGADSRDDTQSYLAIYPEYDWTTLMTRAWGAQRAVDYLYTLDDVDKSKIAITGHSRNGKQSLLAAAFDERITAVITSSGGTGGEVPYRYTDERQSNESIEFLYSRRTHWGHPRIRFYVGREHKMPIDQTSLLALIAPNALLLSSSIREGDGDPWAIEQAYHSLSSVYKFLNVPAKLGIRLRDGEHAVEARDLEGYMDWLDIQFKRKKLPWENKLFYDYSFDKWKSLSKEEIDLKNFPDVVNATSLLVSTSGKNIKGHSDWNERKDEFLKQIRWILGTEPSGFKASPIKGPNNEKDYLASFMNRPSISSGKMINIGPYNAVGDYLHASLYYPTGANGQMTTRENGKIPVVIFLHNFSNMGFDSQLSRLFESIVSKGVAVLAFDQLGYGTRIEEGTLFYQRYPHWSKLGKMIADARGAIDALETLDFVDEEKIFLSGYALGGTVSLFTAALDTRVAGVAVSSGFTPWRDPGNKDREGLKAYSHLYGLTPRLGFFEGHETKVPVDFPEIISLIAPRPLLIIAPELDRHANVEKVTEAVEAVRSVYSLLNVPNKIEYKTPREFNQLTTSQEFDITNWLDKVTRSGAGQ